MKVIVEERIPDKEHGGTEPKTIKEYKRKSYAIKRAEKESRSLTNEVDVRVFNDDYELIEHRIYRKGNCVHSISQ